ncbi:MAG TPA: tetratricopeptide repeat protein [Pseudomonadales bacterium]
MADIFLSYARQDIERVRGIVAKLEAEGWSVWWDRSLKPGETWPDVIERQLKRARCVVVAWSEAAISSPWVRMEANKARERGVLVPLLLESVPLPAEFGAVQNVSLAEDPANGVADLIDGVRGLLRRRATRRYLTAASALAVILALGFTGNCLTSGACARWAEPSLPEGSMAVLRFDNDMEDPQIAEIADAFVDELRETLAEAGHQPVAARAATRAIPATLSPTEIGERLRVRWLVAGSISGSRNHIELAIELIDAANGYLRDSKRYIAIASDLERMRHDITRDLLGMMGISEPESASSTPGSQATSEAYVLYLRGKSMLRQRELEQAEAYFLEALALAPGHPEAQAGLCQLHLARFESGRDSEDIETAKDRCGQALSAPRQSADTALALGALSLAEGELDAAGNSFTRALALNASSADAYIGLARVADSRGQPDEAERLLREGILVQRGYWRPYNELGISLIQQGRLDEAGERFDQALALAPQDGTVLNNLAVTYLMIEQFDRAIGAWTKVLALEPSAAAYGNLGSAYYWSGELDKAVDMYSEAVRLHPEDFRWWSSLGDAQLLLGSADARASFERALEQTGQELSINPDNRVADVGRAPILAALGDSEKARAILDRERAVIEHNPELAYVAAVAAARLGDADRAIAYLDAARDLGYPDILIHADPSFAGLWEEPAKPEKATR